MKKVGEGNETSVNECKFGKQMSALQIGTTASSFLILNGRSNTQLLSSYSHDEFSSIHFSSVQDGIYERRKAHMRSTPFVRRFLNVFFKTVAVHAMRGYFSYKLVAPCSSQL